jgi:hypothetical protein
MAFVSPTLVYSKVSLLKELEVETFKHENKSDEKANAKIQAAQIFSVKSPTFFFQIQK